MTNCPTNIQIQPISLTKQQFELLKTQLSKRDWSVFLESADENHVDSLWSIFSSDPIATLQSFSGRNTFQYNGMIEESLGDPFALLKVKRENLFSQQQVMSELPFVGGILGSINYEVGYQFETIAHIKQPNQLSLPELNLGFYDWALLYNLKDQQFYLVTQVPNYININPKQHWENRYQWLINQLSSTSNIAPFQLTSEWKANMDKQQYEDKFNKIQQYILSGDCYQVNLAQRFNANYQGDEYQAYQALLADNCPPFAAFLRLPQQVILSVSPERFLKLKNDQVESKPIKGTRPRFDDPTLDKQSKIELQNAEKDRSENLMIVDLLRNDIGRVCTSGSVKVPSLFNIESFPAVHHLVSTVTGRLSDENDVEDLLRACFPGGSITGAPKIRSMQIIAELEPHQRQIYCGSIGYINVDGAMDMNIAIRTLVCVNGQIYCWAGGGLVADSEVDAEYQECFDKVSKILPCLASLNVSK